MSSNEDIPIVLNLIHTNRWQKFKLIILNFNIFNNVQSVNNEWEITTERLSTRLFFLFLFITIIILFVYTIITPNILRQTIPQPSQTLYENLFTLYSDSLQCPCSQTSITYSSFISINPIFHPVCQSDFISRDWLEFLSNDNQSYYLNFDFRATGSNQFQLLTFLCQLANESFNLAQTNLIEGSTLISMQLISKTSLLAQADALIKEFSSISPNSFVRLINLIRGLIAGNKLVPIIPTLIMYKIYPNFAILPYPYEVLSDDGYYPTTNGSGCFCNQQVTCSSPSGFYQDTMLTESWDIFDLMYKNTAQIPGLFTGCYPLESLLQSTLECFFNQTCVDFVQINVKPFQDVNFTAIDDNSMTLFTPTWTIEQIIKQLMIDQWNSSVSYEKYFNQCQPLSCTFLEAQRHNALYIVTTLIGLIGGLVSALRLLVPFLVILVRRWWLNRQRNDQSLNILRIPLMQRVSKVICWIKIKISILNIFSNPQIVESEQSEYRGRIATRLYFIIFIISLFILIFYSLFSLHIQTVTVPWPSENEFERLQSLYSSTLKCPCTTISIPYNIFMSINPIYHPICSSQFISQDWTNSLYGIYLAPYRIFYDATDFHLSASIQMSLIRTFCQMVSKTVNDSWYTFEKQRYVSSMSLSRNQFVNEVSSKLEQFILDTTNSFKSSLDLIGMFVQGNQLLIYDSSSMELVLSSRMNTRQISIELQPWIYSNKTTCSCALTSACYSPMSYFYYNISVLPTASFVTYTFSTFYLGCIPVDSLLQSTLSCFFDEFCLKEINYNTARIPWAYPNNSFLTISTNISTLNVSNTRFTPSMKILDIVYQLMIEQWQSSINFTQYYNTCQPSACTYTYEVRVNLLYIATTILAFFGGLNTTLYLIIPLVVKAIKRYQINLRIPIGQQLILVCRKLKQTILTWNLFPNAQTHIDEIIHYRQRIITRIYVFFLICTLVILTLCRSFTSESISQSIDKPSIKDIEQLSRQYSTFDCPCTNVSIPFSKFITIQFRQHPICSSDYISTKWQESLYQNGTINSYEVHDFRKSAFAQFQLLSLLCQLTNTTLYDSLQIFQTNSLITIKILSVESLNLTVNRIIEQFRTITSRQFSLTLEFIRYMMYGNGIHSALQTNWKYLVFNVSIFPPLYSNPISYNENCTCGISPLCSEPATMVINTSNSSEYLLIPGMRVGCYPLEALLQSTLECFYQQTCIDSIIANINTSYQLNFTALDNDNNMNNSTIDILLGNLFLVEWQTFIDYNIYFNSCTLHSCSYSYTRRLALLYVFTTLLGLYGGIVVVFRAIIPFSIKMIFLCQHYFTYRQRVEPMRMNM